MSDTIEGVAEVVKEVKEEQVTTRQYDIYIGKGVDGGAVVYLDRNKQSRIPTVVLAGIGNKEARYDKYLSDEFTKGSGSLRFLAFLHKTGIEKGSIALICECKQKYHAKVIKKFLEDNAEALTMMLPYLFPDEGYKAPESSTMPIPAATTLDQLLIPDHEKEQLAALIKRSELANKEPDTTI